MLLTINPTMVTVLRLHLPHPAFTSEELSAALVELSVPSLRTVYICADAIDPSSLRLFLDRHSGIKSVEYAGFSREGAQRPLFHPPLAHPGLTTLETTAHGNRSSGRLLAALETSPNLHTFCFRFSCFPTAANLAGLIRDLQRLSARTRETTLRLHLWNRDGRTGGARFWVAHPDVRAVAQTLHCVQTVNLLTWSVKTAERTLPWLALLPAVSAVHFTLNFPGRDSELSQAEFTTQKRVFMAKAEAALQLGLVPVPNITVTVC
ncbi:hypothetical protein GGX14DRAFT_542917 [Mycena pura]|uniref:Uncharacterized protein n=1 Tax=Mycena pura TaxID=153505 RepID=A0AAD6VGJ6_9AGAR|nr:hypothetical protein GGX14DRAFT_542917 [Mycena pura]